ncbi:hypothetical protein [Streptomyces brasiliensis]|uniref:Uncharacterized protein n=1 Tax=Streptomyces brasiliensis TaxID=1954 RepID=A0A917PBU2_9ACTN|nr:hypothetical protein [Streptomyces brasiliensis]GGJ69935.1 hypothetical protein GCM10010121_095730 [Streptomyces brasiliensis]
MTAATIAPAASRLLRLELRHNAMAWLLPVVIGLFWLTTYRKDMAMPPMWNLRAAGLQSGAVLDFAVPVTGAAAWMASREVRHRVTDQVTITARPRWARLLAPWVATTIWAMVAYLGCVAVLYGVTAHQASWGGPLWWPAVVAAASLPAFSALGFVLGTFLPSRFTAPLAAIAAFFLLALSTELIHGSQSAWQISPIVTGPWDLGPQAGVAVFYPFAPDLCIAQMTFLVGVTVALLGVPALPAGSAGRAVRLAAACLTGAALLAAGTAVGLAGTGTMDAHGMIDIPALHDAADDQPLRFTPVCSDTTIPVCLNPAYAGFLPATTDALAPLLNQLAGLPGAPDRILQVGVTYQQDTGNGVIIRQDGPRSGATPSTAHLVFPEQLPEPSMTADQMASQLAESFAPDLVARVIGNGRGTSQAQNAVARALLTAAGLPDVVDRTASTGTGRSDGPGGADASGQPDVAPGTPAYAAAERFAALPASARHAWLVQHLAALRAGRITPAQIP